MQATEVLVSLIQNQLRLPPDYQVELIRHRVEVNWRQQYPNPRRQIEALHDSLRHGGPFSGWRLPVHGLQRSLATELETRPSSPDDAALSVTSRIWNKDGVHVGHLALMNLHPVGFRSVGQLRSAINLVTDGLPGYLLSSGRYFHFYGVALLHNDAWPTFLAQFLMPCVLVSPRYIGHSLHRGFCALRLNAVPPIKPKVPQT